MHNLQLIYNFLSGYVPGGFVTLPLVIAFLCFVCYSVNTHSGLLSPGFYRRSLFFSITVPSVIYLAAWFLCPQPLQYQRIMVVPFTMADTTRSNDAWLGRAISESIEQLLWRLGDRKTVIFKQEWLAQLARFTPLTDCDSIRRNIDQFVNIKYLVTGTYTPTTTGYRLTMTCTDRSTGAVVQTLADTVGPQGVVDFNQRAALKIQEWCGLRRPDTALRDITANWAAYRAYHAGMAALRQQKLDDAQRYFEQATVSDTACAYAFVRLAEVGRYKAAALKPDQNQRRVLLEGAVRRGVRACQLEPNLADGYMATAWAYVFMERWLEAQTGMEIAWQLQPLDPAIYYLLSRMRAERYANFKLKNIYDALEKAVALNPVYVAAIFNLVDRLNHQIEHNPRSEELVKRVVAFDPLNIDAGLTMSLTYLYKWRYQESIAMCRQVLAIDSTRAEAYYNIGISFRGLVRNDSATVYLLRAAEMGYLNAYNYLAEMSVAHKKYYTAIKYLRRRVAQGDAHDYFRKTAASRLYTLVHMPGIVVDKNFEFQRLPVSPSLDSVNVLDE